MKSKILNSSRPRFSLRRMMARGGLSAGRFAFGDANAFGASSRPPMPLGTLWDPTLLDRLHTPLSRRHD